MSALAHFGLPHVEIPPLEVTVVRVRTACGDRFFIAAMDDRGELQPLLHDEFRRAIPFIDAECARRTIWRWAIKATAQMTVIYRGDIETCNS